MNAYPILPEQVVKVFEALPDRYLLLSPELVVLTASDAYLATTSTERKAMVGKYFFDVFPGSSATVGGQASPQLLASLQEMLSTKRPHQTNLPPYHHSPSQEGSLVEKGWLSLNTPVLDEAGGVQYIIHKVEEVKELTIEQQRTLPASEALLRSTEVVAHIGSYEADLVSHTFHFSDGLFRLFGHEPGTLVPSLDWMDSRSHPDDVPVVRQIMEEAALSKRPYTYTRRIYRSDGAMRLLETHGSVVCDAEGKTTVFIGLVQDVTERKKAEQQLEESKDLLRSTLNSSPALVQVFQAIRNDEGEIVDFSWRLLNTKAEVLLGNVVGKSLLQNNPGVVASGAFSRLLAVAQTGVPAHFELQYSYEGLDNWYEYTIEKLDDGAVITALEITQWKKAEQEISSSRAFLQSIIDSSLNVIQVFNAVRDQTGQITDFTWKVQNQKGLEQNGEVIGKSLREQNPGVVPSGVFERMVQAVETGVPQVQEQYYSFEQFENQWFYLAIVKQHDGAIMTTRDITAQKKAEQRVLVLKDELTQKATDKYLSLFNSIDAGFCIIEVLFDEHGRADDYRFLEANTSFEKQTGLKNPVGKTMRELAPTHEQYWFDTYGHVAQTGQPARFEKEAKALDRYYDVYAFRVDAPEENRVAILFHDIFEKKQVQEWQAYLLKLSDALRPLSDPEEMQFQVVSLLGEQLRVGRAFYCEIEPDSDAMWIRRDYTDGVQSQTGFFRICDFGPFLVNEYHAGRTVVVPNVTVDPRLTEEQRAMYLAVNVRAFVCVPLVKGGRLVSVLAVNQPTPRNWTRAELLLIEETAERTWAAVERAKAEKALKKSEEQLRLFVQASSNIIYRMSADWSTMEQLLGREFLADTEAPSSDWVKGYILPEDQPLVRDTIEQAIRGKSVFELEHRVILADGGIGWVLSRAVPMLDEKGEITEWFGAGADITLRKQAQQQLQAFATLLEQQVAERTAALEESHHHLTKYRDLLKATLDSSMEMIQVFKAVRDESGRIVDFTWLLNNHTSEKIYGDVIGKSLLESNPGVRKTGIFERLVDVTETGQSQQYEQYYNYEQFDSWFYQSAVKLDDGVATSTADITARKGVELELREARQLLQTIFDHVPISISVLAPLYDAQGAIEDFEIKLANRELERETGRTDLKGKRYAEEYPSIHPSGVFDMMLKAMHTEEVVQGEYFYPHEGFQHWFVSSFVKADGHLVATSMNVTSRKQAEEARRILFEQLRTLVDNTPDAITRWDTNLKIVFANRAFEGITGLSNQELLGSDNHEIGQPESLSGPWIDKLQTVFQTSQPSEHYYNFPTPGKEAHFYSLLVPEFAPDGSVESVLTIARDITELRKAQGELLKSLILLQQTEVVSRIGSWEYNRATDQFYWSEGMYRLFGLPVGSPVTLEIYLDFALEEDRPVAEKIIRQIRQGQEPLSETLRIRVEDRVYTLQVQGIVLGDEEGNPVRMLGVDLDISEVKRLEQENLEMRLEGQNQLLNAILQAQEEERRRISESLHNGVGQILYATKLNLNLLESHFTAGNMPLMPGSFKKTEALLADAIDETRRVSHELVPKLLREFGLEVAINDFCQRFFSSGIAFTCHSLSERLEEYLETAIYRIAQELVNNIVKHSQATRARIEVFKDRNFIYIEAQDNGKGMDTNHGKHREQPDKGVGLKTIYDRTKLLNGSVEIDSASGQGTLITVILPGKRKQYQRE